MSVKDQVFFFLEYNMAVISYHCPIQVKYI